MGVVLCLATAEEVVLNFNTAGRVWKLGMFAELVSQRLLLLQNEVSF